MSLEEKISSEINAAMKAREKDRLEALRAVKAAILLAKTEKAGQTSLSEGDEMAIVQRLLKQRRESAEIYTTQNRPELAQVEEFQANVIAEFLPPMMGDEELSQALKAIIERLGASGPKDMGKVMGTATKELAGKAEGKAISTRVKELLGT
jgi:uncharacterized protein YqeY